MRAWDKRELSLGSKTLLMIFCVVLNLAGRMLSGTLQLPFWLDTIGISVAVCSMGIGGAFVVCIFSVLLAGVLQDGMVAYIAAGIIVVCFQFLYWRFVSPEKSIQVLKMGFWTGILTLFATVPIYMLLGDGKSLNMWGDAFFCMLEWNGVPRWACSFLGAMVVEIVDKQLSVVLAMFLVLLIQKIGSKKAKKPKEKSVAVIALLCVTVNLWNAEDMQVQASGDTTKYVSTIYDNSMGLYSSEANDIAETEDGYIWIGSYAGLTRYDGKDFEFIKDGGIVSVTAMLTDSKGNLWIGTNGGKVALYQNGAFRFFSIFGDVNMNSVRCFAEAEDGSIYVGTSGNICKIDRENTLHILDTGVKYVNSMIFYEDALVGCTSDGDLFVVQKDKVTQLLTTEMMGEYYTCVSKTTDGLLVGTASDEIEKISVVKGRILKDECINAAPLSGITDIKEDSAGNIWLAAENGCGYITAAGTKTINIKEFDSSIECVHEDYEGNVWFASSRYGVLKLSKSIFGELFSEAGAEEGVVNTVCFYEGFFYCGTDNGLVVIDRENGKIVTNALTELLQDARIRCIKEDSNDNLWLCTYSDYGLVRYSAKGEITTFAEEDGATSNRFRSILELSDGTVVAAASNGINFIEDDKITGTLTQEDGLQNPQILCLLEREDGSLYAGSDGAGIYIINDKKIVGHIGKDAGLSSQVVMRITPYGEGFFVVSGESLCYMKDNEVVLLSEFPYYNNYDITIMGDLACVLSSAGIYLTDAEQLANNNFSGYRLYNYHDGLTDGLTANPWNYVSEDGTLYFGTNRGVNYFNPDMQITDKVAYKFGLSSVMYDGITVKEKDGVYYIPEDAKIISLEGSIRNYLSPNVKIRLFIKELTTTPQTVSHEELEALQISNLRYGKYTVCMQVMSDDESTVLQEKNYVLIKDAHTWELPWYPVYLILVSAWLGMFIIWMIIDARLAAEREKELEKVKYQAKGEFLTNMSHEFRTPVNTILGMNEMVMRDNPDERIRECSENIRQASVRLLTLVNDVLDYSAIESGKLEIVTERYFLEDILNDTIGYLQAAAAKKGIDTEYNVEDNLPAKLLGDEGRVKQVIMNILSNAVKYTEKGQIVFSVGGHVKRDIYHLEITVADTGIGINEENVEKIFAEFDRLEFGKDRRIEGTGLGLSIANSLAKQMGGSITLQSVEGSGSVFTVTIPQKVIGSKKIGIYTFVPDTEKGEKIMSFTAPDARVLAVDDNRMNLSVISGLLKRNGIAPDVAFGGSEALELCRKNKYDLIFMDHMMPYPDGIETLHQIRAEKGVNYKTPIVVLTANAVSGARKRYLEEGFDDYLSKPVDVSKLEAVLLRFLTMEMQVEDREGNKPNPVQEKAAKKDVAAEELIVKTTGLQFCGGSEELYAEILESYLEEGRKYRNKLEEYFNVQDWKNYAIAIHALKSTSLGIGAVALSEAAKELELAAKEQDVVRITERHTEFQEHFEKVLQVIAEKRI